MSTNYGAFMFNQSTWTEDNRYSPANDMALLYARNAIQEAASSIEADKEDYENQVMGMTFVWR